MIDIINNEIEDLQALKGKANPYEINHIEGGIKALKKVLKLIILQMVKDEE